MSHAVAPPVVQPRSTDVDAKLVSTCKVGGGHATVVVNVLGPIQVLSPLPPPQLSRTYQSYAVLTDKPLSE